MTPGRGRCTGAQDTLVRWTHLNFFIPSLAFARQQRIKRLPADVSVYYFAEARSQKRVRRSAAQACDDIEENE